MKKRINPRKTIPNFFLMDREARDAVANWLYHLKPKTEGQKSFYFKVRDALSVIDYDYYIAVLEPSVDGEGNLYYKKYSKIAKELTYGEWEKKAKAFYKQDGLKSCLANEYELYLFYALRVALGIWSIEGVCDIVYRNYSYDFRRSGEVMLGGFYDGIGNTAKVVKTCEYKGVKYALCGKFNVYKTGYIAPIEAEYHNDKKRCADYGSGVLVIK